MSRLRGSSAISNTNRIQKGNGVLIECNNRLPFPTNTDEWATVLWKYERVITELVLELNIITFGVIRDEKIV